MFSATPETGSAPQTVKFTDQSTSVTPLTWAWDFNNDGVTDSTLQNPIYDYTVVGTYTAKLTVSNSAGSNAATKTITVNAATMAPVAGFNGTPVSGVAPLTVAFTDVSTNSPTSWAWTFGDGGTSTARNPTYTYAKAGTYTVTQTVRNAVGTNTMTLAGYITVNPAPVPPVAVFDGTPTSGTAPHYVAFNDDSANSPTSWEWTFGDGTTSTLRNPSHSYTKAGTYTVSLKATNAGGSNTLTKAGYITVTTATPTPTPTPVPEAVKASFTATPVTGQLPLEVQFTDMSTGGPTQWSWNFGDKGISTDRHPSHTYTKTGSYTVTLTVQNANGSDKVTMKKFVTVQPVKGNEKVFISLS
jgi:PKD repeat protein